MKPVLESLVWLDKSELSPKEVIHLKYQVLTLASKSDYNSKQIEIFEELDDWIGVPRYYFFKNYEGREFEDVTSFPRLKDFPKFALQLRAGQKIATKDFLDKLATTHKYGGILQADCGSGKTISSLYLASKIKARALVLVHKSDLLNQWIEAIQKALPKAKIGVVQGSTRTFKGAHITVATFQTIRSQMESLDKEGFFDYFGVNIIDETHHIGSDTFTEVLQYFSSRIRIGLTATPRRKDGFEDVFFYNIGPILTVMEGETMKGKYLQTLYKSNVNLRKCKLYGGKGKVSISKMITLLAEDEYRNFMILDTLKDAVASGRKVLVLSNRKQQLVDLHKHWRKKVGNNSGLYTGGMKAEELKISATKDLIFGTAQLFAEGTDIKELDCLCLISPMGDIQQAIGRIQRVCAGKKEPFIWDIVDNNDICLAMAKKRRKFYDKTGFTEQK